MAELLIAISKEPDDADACRSSLHSWNLQLVHATAGEINPLSPFRSPVGLIDRRKRVGFHRAVVATSTVGKQVVSGQRPSPHASGSRSREMTRPLYFSGAVSSRRPAAGEGTILLSVLIERLDGFVTIRSDDRRQVMSVISHLDDSVANID